MKRLRLIPNILSASRIVLCLPLLLVDAMTMLFWVLYVIAGTTDMLDGFLARRWGVESKLGGKLDSLADFVFVLAVGYKLLPWLKLPTALWMMIGVIALVKIVNAISSYVVNHRIQFLHTKANKLTGFLLFVGMMTIGQSYFIPVAWIIACIALFAAIQEGHFIRTFAVENRETRRRLSNWNEFHCIQLARALASTNKKRRYEYQIRTTTRLS